MMIRPASKSSLPLVYIYIRICIRSGVSPQTIKARSSVTKRKAFQQKMGPKLIIVLIAVVVAILFKLWRPSPPPAEPVWRASPPPAEPVSSRRIYPYSFLTGDVAYATSRKYDYIIVGGGTAGCPLAATLSEEYSVLVLERGDTPYGDPDIENESGIMKPLSKADEYYSVAQNFEIADGINGTRGRVLGGSSALNAGFYSRASVEDIEQLRLWDLDLVHDSYEWVEREVAFKPLLSEFHQAVRRGLLDEGVGPNNGYTLEHIPGTKISDYTFDNGGKRHSSADHLKRAVPDNIVVLLNSTAKRILFDTSASGKPKAVGIEFVNKENTVSHKVYLKENGEVLLTAGALGSPQLLLLSGIGRADHLKEFGIPVVVDLPGVGKQVADNPRSDLYMLSRKPWTVVLVQVVGILENPYTDSRKDKNRNIYLREGRNPNIYFEQGTLVKDVQVGKETKQAFIGWLVQKLGHPLSRGELRLQTLDPRGNPWVRYNYYSDPFDLDCCVKGTRIMGKILNSERLQRFGYANPREIPEYQKKALAEMGPPLPEDPSDDETMRRFCRDSVATIWHYHGGCNIGSVIDDNYNVMGVDGLRVLDASTFITTPGTNPQATIMMLGRYKGVEILRERKARATGSHSEI